MGTEIVKAENQDLIFAPENLTKETIKKFLCPMASEQELIMGLQIAKSFGLNPLKREIYFVKYGSEPMAILTGYEVYLKRAERSGKYAGMRSWCEGSVEKGDLKGCVEVFVKGWDRPLIHEADYSEYVQKRKDGTVNRFWKEKPKTMIKKVAISQAFRMAFPDEFDGMPYTRDEVIDVEAVESKPLPQPIEMPKLKEEAPVMAIAEPVKPIQAPIAPKAEEVTGLSDKTLEKIGKAHKFLGEKVNYIYKMMGIEVIKTEEEAETFYKEAYKLYKAEKGQK